MMRGLARNLALALLAAAALPSPASADVFRPAYLELKQKSADTYDVLWKVPAVGESMRLAIHVRFPEGTVQVTEPRGVFSIDALIERWTIRRPGGLAGGEIRIEGLPGSVTDVLARVEREDGTTQVARLIPSRPRFVVESPQDESGVARTYLVLGVRHILGGVDHLLFVLALILIVDSRRRLLVTITAFTLAHSITLAMATLGVVHVPQAPVEAAIALSIVFVAAEIVHGLQGRPGLTARAPWVVSFSFGLLHGLGFAGALAEVGLPERAIRLALLFFNVGVELGQVLFVGGVWAVLLVHRPERTWPRWVQAVPAYAIGAMAMFWVIERTLAFMR
ncbi:MAG TPA: HupE/UreJ family protein [Vicinamibacteria bacterium]|nr:HupE/UreJ family protein [Vicinamibacteria bacterium]